MKKILIGAIVATASAGASAQTFYQPYRPQQSRQTETSSWTDIYNNPGYGAVQVGYRGFIDIAYTAPVGKDSEGRIEFTTTHGYQITPYLYFGIGSGMVYYYDYDGESYPIYADIRTDLLPQRWSPFVDLRVGYSAGDARGLYVAPSVGVRYGLSNSAGISLSIGYSLQKYRVDDRWDPRYPDDDQADRNVNWGGFTVKVALDF